MLWKQLNPRRRLAGVPRPVKCQRNVTGLYCGPLSPSSNRTWDKEIYLLTSFIKVATSLSHLTFPYIKCTISFTVSVFSSSHPRLKQLSLTHTTGVCSGWRQKFSPVPSFSEETGDWLRLSPVPAAPCEAWHAQFCLSPFHGNAEVSGQGQIFKQGVEVQFLVTAHKVYLHL